jgi:hypothetical protein
VLRHSFLFNIPEHGAIIAAAAISQLA